MKDIPELTGKARNIYGSISELKYSLYIRMELPENLVDNDLAKEKSSEVCIGRDTVQITLAVEGGKGKRKTQEGRIDYIYQHSMKRSQDLMTICQTSDSRVF